LTCITLVIKKRKEKRTSLDKIIFSTISTFWVHVFGLKNELTASLQTQNASKRTVQHTNNFKFIHAKMGKTVKDWS
jgi:hypothetical protein